MKPTALSALGVGFLLTGCNLLNFDGGDPPKTRRLLTLPPESMSLETPLQDYRLEPEGEWSIQSVSENRTKFVWKGFIDAGRDDPNLRIRQAGRSISPLSSLDHEAAISEGYRVWFGKQVNSMVEGLQLRPFEHRRFVLHIPSSTAMVQFEAQAVSVFPNQPRLHFAIEDIWEATVSLTSTEWKTYRTAPAGIDAGTYIVHLTSAGDREWDRHTFLRDLQAREPTRIEVFGPADSSTPEVAYRPESSFHAFLRSLPSTAELAPEPHSPPWRVYDEEDRFVRPFEIRRLVRTALFMPTPSKWTVRSGWKEGSSLLIFPAVQNPLAPRESYKAILRVSLETENERRKIWEELIGPTRLRPELPPEFKVIPLLPWQVRMEEDEPVQPRWESGVRIPLPEMGGKEAHLSFESFSPEGESRSQPFLLGEPLLLPPSQTIERSPLLEAEDVLDWPELFGKLVEGGKTEKPSPARRFWRHMDWKARVAIAGIDPDQPVEDTTKEIALDALNEVLQDNELYLANHFRTLELESEFKKDFEEERVRRSEKTLRLNRELLDRSFPEQIVRSLQYESNPADRPDIVLISLDTLRADALSCLGYDRETSPWMKEFFGKSGVRFTQTAAPSTWTLPSHVSVFVSQYVSRHGVKMGFHSASPSADTLAEIMARLGYRTAAFVDRGYLDHRYGFYQGFERYEQKGGGVRTTLPDCVEWLEELDRTSPVFLFLHTYDIHDPYSPPPGFRERFLTEDMAPSRPDFGVPVSKMFDAFNKGWVPFTQGDIEYARALYDGGVLYVDEALRRFFQVVERRKLLTDPLVIVFSDHGEGFAEHGLWGHGWSVYEELAHVPLLMRFPGEEYAGAQLAHRVSLVDIAPTILDRLDQEIPEDWQGVSLLPILENPQETLNRTVYVGLEETFGGYQGFLKMIQKRNRIWSAYYERYIPKREVYDLENDPYEQKNIISEAPIDVSAEFKRLEQAVHVMEEQQKMDGNLESADLDSALIQELQALGYLQ